MGKLQNETMYFGTSLFHGQNLHLAFRTAGKWGFHFFLLGNGSPLLRYVVAF